MDSNIIKVIKDIIANSRENAIRSVDNARTLMYWSIGKRIFEEEQQGKERADYGSYLLEFISKELLPEYGNGFSKRELERYRQFYRTLPIATTLRSQLSWSQYKLVMSLKDNEQRDFYIAESTKK